MPSRTARKRHEWARKGLLALEHDLLTAPPSGVDAAFLRYRYRLGEIQAGWRNEMRRRAGQLLEADGTAAKRVWELVEDLREALGDRYGDMAAEIAVAVLAPVQRQHKPLTSRKTE